MMSLPLDFIAELRGLLPDEWQALASALTDAQASVSVRVNTRRGVAVPAAAARVPWCEAGFYCHERQAFTFDPDFHAGRYYVQEAASMFIHRVLRSLPVAAPVCYLDLCAAPGGKTTAALDALPGGSLVVANDAVLSRARVLRDNIVKWGNPNAVVTCAPPKTFGSLGACFDIIAADVPCSGEGMMRKDAGAVTQWSPALVRECAVRQRTIIDDVWPALRPGGWLIYSTCSFNREENEQMVEYVMAQYGAEPVAVPVDQAWNIMPAIGSEAPCYRFLPHCTRSEGLFMAVLRKPGNAEGGMGCSARAVRDTGRKASLTGVPSHVGRWINLPDNCLLAVRDGAVLCVPRKWDVIERQLRGTCMVLHTGVTLGVMKRESLIPDHSLALSTALRSEAFPRCEVDCTTALAYLRGEAMVLDAPRGYLLITHRNACLGWVNNLGNRANNLYPKSLRILSQYAPTVQPIVLDTRSQ